jgi:hypothetical protein
MRRPVRVARNSRVVRWTNIIRGLRGFVSWNVSVLLLILLCAAATAAAAAAAAAAAPAAAAAAALAP